MNACQDWRDRLLDAAVGAPMLGELEHHLLECHQCSAALAELRTHCEQMEAGLHQLMSEPKLSPGFRPGLVARFEAPRMRIRWTPAWAAVLATCMVWFVWLIAHWPGRTQSVAAPALESSLSQWHSPTASLLHAPGEEFWQSNPRLGEFYFPVQASRKANPEGTKERKP